MLSFLHNFKLVCDSNGFHEGATEWLFQYVMKDLAKAALVQRVIATKQDVP